MRRTFGRIVEIYKPFKWVMFVLLAYIIAGQALMLITPYLHGKIIDAIINKKQFVFIFTLATVALVVGIGYNLIGYFHGQYELKRLAYDAARHVSEVVLEKMLGFSVGQHSNENSGVKQSVISVGEHSLTSFVYTILYEVLPLVAQVLLTIGILLYLNLILGVAIILGITVFVYFTIKINWNLRDDLKKSHDLRYDMDSNYAEILRNIEIVEVNAQEKKTIAEHLLKVRAYNDFGKDLWSRYSWSSFKRYNFIHLSKFAVIVLGAYHVITGHYTAGFFLIFLTWSSDVFNRLGSIGHLQRRLIEMYAAIKKLFAILDIEPAVKEIENPVRPEEYCGRIEFRNVSFAYPRREVEEDKEKKLDISGKTSGTDALSGINFAILPGETVAFVGPSGGGKSTIVKLLTRAYDPQSGQVIIDGNDLRVLDLTHYREHLGVVEQDVNLFDNTLRYNMVFGLNGRGKDVRDSELDAISRSVCLDRFFSRLENGYDTIVGEKGIRLSGGERQRVGIARALIKNSQILILDEATSHLDTENESLVHQSIENAARGRTTVIVAHRLSTVRKADKIFVVDGGCIVATGTHDELLAASDVYRRLVGSQLVH